MDPDAMTATRWPLEMESTARWMAVM